MSRSYFHYKRIATIIKCRIILCCHHCTENYYYLERFSSFYATWPTMGRKNVGKRRSRALCRRVAAEYLSSHFFLEYSHTIAIVYLQFTEVRSDFIEVMWLSNKIIRFLLLFIWWSLHMYSPSE